jgi:sigma-B regulation protein RsbU (phosphoserine phosphatase)
MFVTLFYGRLDPTRSKLVYINAGHNPPLHYRASKRELAELTRTGIMVGFDDSYKYTQRTVSLARGDLVLFYTDGVTESVNAEDEQFGEERLRRVVLENAAASPAEIVQAIKRALDEFTGAIAPFDDVTLMIAKRLAR